MSKSEKILAYDMKAKKKTEMLKAKIDRTGNRYFAKGVSKEGNIICIFIGAEKAKAAIKNGLANKGKGW